MVIILDYEYFPTEDADVAKFMLDTKDIVNSLTPQQIIRIVYALGADRHEEQSNCIIFPTICHNPDVSEASMKLYYYFDRRLFKCYTECDETFNVVGLIQRVQSLNGDHDYTYNEARDFLMDFFDASDVTITRHGYTSIMERYRRHIGATVLPEYGSNILSSFIKKPYLGWLEEGMSAEAIAQFNIMFSISHNAIIIPHYDIDDRLVGIRVRNLDYVKDGSVPKYCPLITPLQTYTHPLSLNLYGLNRTKNAISRQRKAIVYESEKSVILHQTYFGNDNNSVAVCGSNLSKPQVDLLVRNCRINELIIAFDKEYEDYDSQKAVDYFNKLYNIGSQYLPYTTVSFIYDSKNLLKEKDSPADRGKEIFQQLYASRVTVK